MRPKILPLLALVLSVATVGAQTLRDPTLAPAAARPAQALVAKSSEPSVDVGKVAVLVRDGTPYLMWGTRLFATGQLLGTARIERITESEIWLRQAGKLEKVQVFEGVERRLASPVQKP